MSGSWAGQSHGEGGRTRETPKAIQLRDPGVDPCSIENLNGAQVNTFASRHRVAAHSAAASCVTLYLGCGSLVKPILLKSEAG